MEADSAATFATADGIAVGTVDYMSPEQACGREVDGRSDLYGLGCSMYHLMTAKLPFPGSSPIERLGKRISGRHVPITEHLPDLPPSFVRVIDRLLAHKPHERYPTAADAADALQSLIRTQDAARSGSAAQAPAAQRAPCAVARSSPMPNQPSPRSSRPPAPADGPMVVKVRPKYPALVRAPPPASPKPARKPHSSAIILGSAHRVRRGHRRWADRSRLCLG